MSKKDSHTLGESLVSIAARFPTSLAAQIDDHLAAMRRTIPGITLGRSDALRSLVLHALEALYGPSAGGAPDIITDTSTRRLLQKEKRRAREGGVADTVTETSPLRLLIQQEIRALKAGTVTDTSPLRRMIGQEFEDFLESRTALLKSIDRAQPVTDTVTDTHGQPEGVRGAAHATQGVTDTVTDTESVTDTVTDTAAAPPATRKAPSRRRAVTDTVTDTAAPQPPAPNAPRRKRLPIAY